MAVCAICGKAVSEDAMSHTRPCCKGRSGVEPRRHGSTADLVFSHTAFDLRPWLRHVFAAVRESIAEMPSLQKAGNQYSLTATAVVV